MENKNCICNGCNTQCLVNYNFLMDNEFICIIDKSSEVSEHITERIIGKVVNKEKELLKKIDNCQLSISEIMELCKENLFDSELKNLTESRNVLYRIYNSKINKKS